MPQQCLESPCLKRQGHSGATVQVCTSNWRVGDAVRVVGVNDKRTVARELANMTYARGVQSGLTGFGYPEVARPELRQQLKRPG